MACPICGSNFYSYRHRVCDTCNITDEELEKMTKRELNARRKEWMSKSALPKLKVADLLESAEKSQNVKERVLQQLSGVVKESGSPDRYYRYFADADAGTSVSFSPSATESGSWGIETSESVSISPSTSPSPSFDD